ncbi:MAG: ABC transporter substrate-binding protein [Rhodospirillales bacterium]|nr:ABC transporter substrate-binding protein [Rhodospirillales bacterium]
MATSRFISGLLAAVLTAAPLGAEAAERLKAIQRHGEIRVCIWPDYFSITYRNPRTGELQGIDIDMAQALAADLGVKAHFVDSSFALLARNLTGDICDIAMHAVGVRADRAEHMDFSRPHLVSGIYAVTTRSHPTVKSWDDIDQPGIAVVVQKGTYMEPVMRDTLKHAELVVVDDFKAREQEVQSGRADVFMTDYPYGLRMVSLTDWARLIEPPRPFATTPYAYAVPKGEPDWQARVERFLAEAKADGRLRAAAERHGLLPILAKE